MQNYQGKRKFLLVRSIDLLFLLILGIGANLQFNSCKSPDISDNPPQTPDAIKLDSANLRVSNQISQDLGTIEIFLFPPNSLDITNATKGIGLGIVKAGETINFRVPAGKWKIAYQDRTKNRHAMQDETSSSQEWVTSEFLKKVIYTLILKTDGNYTQWVPDFVTQPPLN